MSGSQTDETTFSAPPPATGVSGNGVRHPEPPGLTKPIPKRLSAVALWGLIGAGAFLVVYRQTLMDLAAIWMERDDFSHGFLIPLFSLYVAWLKRDVLMALASRPSLTLGLPVMIAAGVLLLIGDAGGIVTLEGISLVVMVAGLVLSTSGVSVLRAWAFPIGYLLLMVPIFDGVIARIQWPFQLFTAEMSVAMLRALGYVVLLDRQYIVLPSITLEVATVCSGVGYLVAILAVGVPVAYLALSRWWTRVGLLVGAVAIGIVANWVRVALIGMWAAEGGEVVHGPFHVFQGLFVAWVGFGVLFAGAWALARLERKTGGTPTTKMPLETRYVGSIPSRGAQPWVLVVALLVGLGVVLETYPGAPTPLRAPLASLPLTLGEWTALPGRPAPPVDLGVDDELSRTYRLPNGRQADVYIGYVAKTSRDKEVVNNRTAAFHQGAASLTVPEDGGGMFSANAVELPATARRVVYWYDVRGDAIADRYRAKWATIEGALLHGESSGAFIAISERNMRLSESEAASLAAALRGALRGHFP